MLRKIWNASQICMSSLLRDHANLLCIIPTLEYVLPKQAQGNLKKKEHVLPYYYTHTHTHTHTYITHCEYIVIKTARYWCRNWWPDSYTRTYTWETIWWIQGNSKYNNSGILNHGKRINYSTNSAVITGFPFAKSTK